MTIPCTSWCIAIAQVNLLSGVLAGTRQDSCMGLNGVAGHQSEQFLDAAWIASVQSALEEVPR